MNKNIRIIAAMLIVLTSTVISACSSEDETPISVYNFSAGDDVPVDILMPGSHGFTWIKWDIDVYVEQYEDRVLVYPLHSLPKPQIWPLIEQIDNDYICSGGYGPKRRVRQGEYWTAYTEACGEALIKYGKTIYNLNPKYEPRPSYLPIKDKSSAPDTD